MSVRYLDTDEKIAIWNVPTSAWSCRGCGAFGSGDPVAMASDARSHRCPPEPAEEENG